MPRTSFRTFSLNAELFTLNGNYFKIELQYNFAPIVFNEYIVNESTTTK